MTETRAVARLPRLEIEIRHREAPEEGAEYLSVSLKAMPGFDAAAAWFHPMGFMLGWLALADAMSKAWSAPLSLLPSDSPSVVALPTKD